MQQPEPYKLETKEDFDRFLLVASKLEDTGEDSRGASNLYDLEDALNFRYTI